MPPIRPEVTLLPDLVLALLPPNGELNKRRASFILISLFHFYDHFIILFFHVSFFGFQFVFYCSSSGILCSEALHSALNSASSSD